MTYKMTALCAAILSFVGCQPLPTQTRISQPPSASTEIKQPSVVTPEGVKITPYTQAEIKRETAPIIAP